MYACLYIAGFHRGEVSPKQSCFPPGPAKCLYACLYSRISSGGSACPAPKQSCFPPGPAKKYETILIAWNNQSICTVYMYK